MPWKKTPLFGQSYESVDEVELDDLRAMVQDFYVNELEHLLKRPCLESFVDLGTLSSVDGLFWWEQEQAVIAVSGGRVWKITDQSGAKTELTGSTELLIGAQVSIDTDGTKVILANGGKMVHTTIGGPLTTMADADAPIQVTHVAFLDGYILANLVNSKKVFRSDLNDLTGWQALNFFSAEGDPDNVLALKQAYRELILLGSQSVEFWINDGSTPFSRLSGSVQPFGISAVYSLQLAGNTWIWLDQNRQLVTMQNRVIVPVSNPYERIIQEMLSVDDAVSQILRVDHHIFYVLTFPTGATTLVFNVKTPRWQRWGTWDGTTASYKRWRPQSGCYARTWNMRLVGDHQNGKIYKATRSVFQDDGATVRSLVRTGHISHGTSTDKRSNEVRITAKRGVANAAVADPQLTMRVRRDNRPFFGNERWLKLGQVGKQELHLHARRNGMYRTAQFEFVHSDATDCILVSAEEDIEFLGS